MSSGTTLSRFGISHNVYYVTARLARHSYFWVLLAIWPITPAITSSWGMLGLGSPIAALISPASHSTYAADSLSGCAGSARSGLPEARSSTPVSGSVPSECLLAMFTTRICRTEHAHTHRPEALPRITRAVASLSLRTDTHPVVATGPRCKLEICSTEPLQITQISRNPRRRTVEIRPT